MLSKQSCFQDESEFTWQGLLAGVLHALLETFPGPFPTQFSFVLSLLLWQQRIVATQVLLRRLQLR
jgi:hypothetical protein